MSEKKSILKKEEMAKISDIFTRKDGLVVAKVPKLEKHVTSLLDRARERVGDGSLVPDAGWCCDWCCIHCEFRCY